jgi:hypothetical protein
VRLYCPTGGTGLRHRLRARGRRQAKHTRSAPNRPGRSLQARAGRAEDLAVSTVKTAGEFPLCAESGHHKAGKLGVYAPLPTARPHREAALPTPHSLPRRRQAYLHLHRTFCSIIVPSSPNLSLQTTRAKMADADAPCMYVVSATQPHSALIASLPLYSIYPRCEAR